MSKRRELGGLSSDLGDWQTLRGDGFLVSLSHECEKCHKKALTIKDPEETGAWVCRRCTRLSDDAFVKKAKSMYSHSKLIKQVTGV